MDPNENGQIQGGGQDGSLPLAGLLVLDFSQFLAGPSCALRLADLGARVIKIERPVTGDLGRQLYISDLELEDDSLLFHTINRNKQSLAADLKGAEDRARVTKLMSLADVMIQSFRPNVMERLGFGYDSVREINPRLVYATITGFGKEGPWRDKPGQDLVVQALSGLTWLSGDDYQGPVPFGLAAADLIAGAHLAQGILAALVRRGVTGKGSLVEVSLLESILDYQFEVLTSHLNDGGQPPHRSEVRNAHAYLGAPYGVYETADGYIALAMGSVPRLGELLECRELLAYTDPKTWFSKRDEIKRTLADHLVHGTTERWLEILERADVWCADVFTWSRLREHDGFKVLRMTQKVRTGAGNEFTTTRCPIRIDGHLLTSELGAPRVGEHTDLIIEEFGLDTVEQETSLTLAQEEGRT